MNRSLLLVFAVVVSAAPSFAQQPVLSPRDSVTLTLDSNRISINYGRPSMRGRKIMGGLVPWDKVWRAGANQATHLKSNFDMTLGGVPVPRGTYTLWSIPSPVRWKIIISNHIGQWGTQYDERQDRARINATPATLPVPVDTFLITLEPTGPSSGVLKLKWEYTSVSVPFERNDRIRPVSPLDSSEVRLGGKTVKVRFSRPSMRGRSIWGVLVPMDSVWRTGANAVTALITEAELQANGTTIPRGTYSLYSLPAEKGMTLIINRQQAGTEPAYQSSLDVARFPMALERPSDPIDPFRIWLAPQTRNSFVLKIGWADRVYAVRMTTK